MEETESAGRKQGVRFQVIEPTEWQKKRDISLPDVKKQQ